MPKHATNYFIEEQGVEKGFSSIVDFMKKRGRRKKRVDTRVPVPTSAQEICNSKTKVESFHKSKHISAPKNMTNQSVGQN